MQTNTVMNIGDEAARRRLILALGRGKSGKTLWSRWLVETMRARGVSPVAADADWSTPGLSRHDEDAVRLGSEPQADRTLVEDGAGERRGTRRAAGRRRLQPGRGPRP